MNFNTNFSPLSLISNQPIRVIFENKYIDFMAPPVKDYLMNYEFAEFMYYLRLTVEEFNTHAVERGGYAESKYGIIKLILLLAQDKRESIIKYFTQIFTNTRYDDYQFFVGEFEISDEEYETMLEFLFVSCGETEMEPFLKKIDYSSGRPLSKIEQIMKDNEEKIKKRKKKKKETEDKANAVTMDQVVIAILYEFPSLTLDKIIDMNMYSLLTFWKYVGKVVDNQIQIVAAGNGNIKEFTYFIN